MGNDFYLCKLFCPDPNIAVNINCCSPESKNIIKNYKDEKLSLNQLHNIININCCSSLSENIVDLNAPKEEDEDDKIILFDKPKVNIIFIHTNFNNFELSIPIHGRSTIDTLLKKYFKRIGIEPHTLRDINIIKFTYEEKHLKFSDETTINSFFNCFDNRFFDQNFEVKVELPIN